jgi:FMN-dependent oxidoreductase (nitrilotriacetate monooxygenase family)
LETILTASRPKRLKTLVGAASVLHASGDASPALGPQRAAALARKAESARITGLFTADVLQVDPTGVVGTTGSQEPLIALAALSQVTSHIGLIATVSTTFQHPYNLARQIATLDHASGGRAAWNAVTSSTGEENFGVDALPDPVTRYARATEFVEVVHALFAANEADAATRGPNGAIRIDPARLHRVDYRGEHFQVQGPLNVPQPPQGRPVQFQAGQSAEGVTLGARYAEAVYTSQPQLDGAVAFAHELRGQARAFGRAENLPLIMNSFHSVIGESDADVARRVREKRERIDYDKGRVKLADMFGGEVDLSGLPLDRPLPESLLPDVDDTNRRRGRIAIFRRYALQGLTLRELIVEANETGHWSVAGTPEQLADAIEERFRLGILDVLSLHGLGNPDQEDLLLNGLLPELRRRELLDDDYVEGGFRANLGLPAL